MDQRVSCVFEVCGAFGGRVLGEDFAAGVGDGFVGSRPGLSEQGLELGEDLLNGVEVGGVFWQEHKAGSDIPDRLAHRLSLVRAEIVEDHDVARHERRDKELFDIGGKRSPLMGPSNRQGASIINNVNAYHSRLKQLLTRFNGVAIKNLPSYLGWRRALEAWGEQLAPQTWITGAIGNGPYQAITL